MEIPHVFRGGIDESIDRFRVGFPRSPQAVCDEDFQAHQRSVDVQAVAAAQKMRADQDTLAGGCGPVAADGLGNLVDEAQLIGGEAHTDLGSRT
ncbi:hypothetical protein [Novosphingobium soli]|uniref:hypothetical protein n=1 Tax=Novosphingobium soli TaxID=574956 RepID=UPI0036D33CF3